MALSQARRDKLEEQVDALDTIMDEVEQAADQLERASEEANTDDAPRAAAKLLREIRTKAESFAAEMRSLRDELGDIRDELQGKLDD